MKKNNEKTNVMRILDQNGINYESYVYADNPCTNGLEVANLLKKDPNQVFKTLVTISKSNKNYVFLVPVNKELDLKKAAQAVNEKNVEMLKSSELLGLTGYIHGGCSPIGMKKQFVTVIDASAFNYSSITFSGGKIGYQVSLEISNLEKVLKYNVADIIK